MVEKAPKGEPVRRLFKYAKLTELDQKKTGLKINFNAHLPLAFNSRSFTYCALRERAREGEREKITFNDMNDYNSTRFSNEKKWKKCVCKLFLITSRKSEINIIYDPYI